MITDFAIIAPFQTHFKCGSEQRALRIEQDGIFGCVCVCMHAELHYGRSVGLSFVVHYIALTRVCARARAQEFNRVAEK